MNTPASDWYQRASLLKPDGRSLIAGLVGRRPTRQPLPKASPIDGRDRAQDHLAAHQPGSPVSNAQKRSMSTLPPLTSTPTRLPFS